MTLAPLPQPPGSPMHPLLPLVPGPDVGGIRVRVGRDGRENQEGWENGADMGMGVRRPP